MTIDHDSSESPVDHLPREPGSAEAFGLLVARTRIERRADRDTLARMLAQVAAADGHISADQRRFFGVFTDRSEDDIDRLADTAPVSAAELARVSPDVQQAALAFAAAMAFATGRYLPAEADLVWRYAEVFGIDPDARIATEDMARAWLLEEQMEHLYRLGHPAEEAYAAFLETAAALGIEPDVLEQMETEFLWRKGWSDRRGAIDRPAEQPAKRMRTTAGSILDSHSGKSLVADWAGPTDAPSSAHVRSRK